MKVNSRDSPGLSDLDGLGVEVGAVGVDAGFNGLEVEASGGSAPGGVEGDQVVVGALKEKEKEREKKRKRKGKEKTKKRRKKKGKRMKKKKEEKKEKEKEEKRKRRKRSKRLVRTTKN